MAAPAAAAERLRALLFSLDVALRRLGSESSAGSSGNRGEVLTLVNQILDKGKVVLRSSKEVQRDEKVMVVALLLHSVEPPDLLQFVHWGGIGGAAAKGGGGGGGDEGLRKSKELVLSSLYGIVKTLHASGLLQGHESRVFHAVWGVYRRGAGQSTGVSELLFHALRLVALLLRLYPELANEQVKPEKDDLDPNVVLKLQQQKQQQQQQRQKRQRTKMEEEQGEEDTEEKDSDDEGGGRRGRQQPPPSSSLRPDPMKKEIPVTRQMVRVFRKRRLGQHGREKASRVTGQELKTAALVLSMLWEQVSKEGEEGGVEMVLKESKLLLQYCKDKLGEVTPPSPDVMAGIFGAIDRLLNVTAGPFEGGGEGGREGGVGFLFVRVRVVLTDFVGGNLSRYAHVGKILRLLEHHAGFFRECLTGCVGEGGGGGGGGREGGGLMETFQWMQAVYAKTETVRGGGEGGREGGREGRESERFSSYCTFWTNCLAFLFFYHCYLFLATQIYLPPSPPPSLPPSPYPRCVLKPRPSTNTPSPPGKPSSKSSPTNASACSSLSPSRPPSTLK